MHNVSIITAFLAGIVMFFAPCTLPIVPGFVVFISSGEKNKAIRNSLLFSLGFSLTFLLFGLLAGLLGQFLLPYKVFIQKIGAIFIIIFGFYSLGIFNLPLFKNQPVQEFFQKFLKKKISPFIFGVSFACG
jgi:cytochrome c-type biogenesis protein